MLTYLRDSKGVSRVDLSHLEINKENRPILDIKRLSSSEQELGPGVPDIAHALFIFFLFVGKEHNITIDMINGE